MLELIKQYEQEGKNISALRNDYESALDKRSTTLGLNQWQASDKPTMAQFNEDNRIIDEKLRALADGKANTADVETALGNKVNVETPQEYDFPLTSVAVKQSKCAYYKNQFGEVSLIFNVKSADNKDSFIDNNIIGTLPVGFRPSELISFPTTGINLNSTRQPGVAHVSTAGALTLSFHTTNACAIACGQITFIAAH